MVRANRLAATLTTTAILASTLIFAYGYYLNDLEKLFSYDLLSMIFKFVLGVAMIIIVFFARPRWIGHRILLGVIATAAMGFAGFGAFTNTLLTGDALIYAFGAMIAAFEATEVSGINARTGTELRLPTGSH